MTTKIKIDPSEKGLGMVFKDYEILALETLWENPGHMFSSLEVLEAVNEKLAEKGESISRASIINFLQDTAEERLLVRNTTTGKGGHRGIYQTRYDETGFKKHIVKIIIEKLRKEFPEAVRLVIKEMMR